MKLRPILRVVRAPNRWVCSYCGSTIQPGETALKLGSVVFAVWNVFVANLLKLS